MTAADDVAATTAYTFPGATYTYLAEADHVPHVEPDGMRTTWDGQTKPDPDALLHAAGWAFATGTTVRRGFGVRITAHLTDEQRDALADYLDSCVGVLRSMTPSERGESGAGEIRACEAGLRALGFGPVKEEA